MFRPPSWAGASMPVKPKKSRIDVAVFPVAGRGTRFLPATKASPKEMLPIVDKPLIQYAVEEALAAGARRLVFITGSSKRAIEDHFDSDGELENLLLKQGKSDLLNTLRSVLPSYASCIYIRQPAPLGLGHAVLCAKPAVGDAPFFVHLADDLIDAQEACLKQMADRFDNGSIVAVQTVPHAQTDKYGIVKTGARRGDLLRVERIVEKPKPSARRRISRWWVATCSRRASSRTWSASARARAARSSSPTASRGSWTTRRVYAYRFAGKRFDCGSKIGYLQANVEYALAHPELAGPFRDLSAARWSRTSAGRASSLLQPAQRRGARRGARHLEAAHVAQRARQRAVGGVQGVGPVH